LNQKCSDPHVRSLVSMACIKYHIPNLFKEKEMRKEP
jgi:hypothetical protein